MSTILFEQDWYRHPGAIVDEQTTNKSFVRYAALLKKMGVKNHSFCLALHDPKLQGVDPFDPNLSQETKKRIVKESLENFWYYIREIARTKKGDPFVLNRGNMALFWLFHNHVTPILIQIRQTGKSFSTDTLMNWLMNIRCRKTEINLLTKDETLRASNLARLKELMLQLPNYLKMYRPGFDVGNGETISVKKFGNTYRGHLPQSSPKLAYNVGRGLTSPIFQIDEAAFFKHIAISMPAALAAGGAERDLARLNGTPYGTIITTTAGKKDDRDGAYVYKLLLESAPWTEFYFDCQNEETLWRTVMRGSSSEDLMVNCTFNHRQLGYTDEWLRMKIKEAKALGEDADRDFGNIWTAGSLTSPLTVEISERIRDSQVEPNFVDISKINAYSTRWYMPQSEISGFMRNEDTVLSIDTSDAVGQDDIGLVLRSVRTGSVVAAGNYNETNLLMFAEWIADFLIKNPKVTLIIERRSSAIAILDIVCLRLVSEGIDPFRRIYNRIVQEQENYQTEYAQLSKPLYARERDFYERNKRHFGYATSGSGSNSRNELYGNTFLNNAKLTADRVHDKPLINQILGLVIRNGRIDHTGGSHDDMVVAWNMSGWLLFSGKNLSFYGIDSSKILADNKAAQDTFKEENSYETRMQLYVRSKVEEIVNELQRTRDDFLAQRLEATLRNYERLLSEQDRRYLSADDLIRKLRENRKQTYRFNRH